MARPERLNNLEDSRRTKVARRLSAGGHRSRVGPWARCRTAIGCGFYLQGFFPFRTIFEGCLAEEQTDAVTGVRQRTIETRAGRLRERHRYLPVSEWPHYLRDSDSVLRGRMPRVYFTELADDAEFDRHVIDVLQVMRREPRQSWE